MVTFRMPGPLWDQVEDAFKPKRHYTLTNLMIKLVETGLKNHGDA